MELSDDTGATIQAWMQPSFVQMEKQQHGDNNNGGSSSLGGGPLYIKPGYVWCLENVTIMLQQSMGNNIDASNTINDDNGPEINNNNNNNNKSLRRMLLISERSVTNVWTQESLDQIDENTFVRWVEETGQ